MLTASVFTIAWTRKLYKCPPTEEWVKKMWYIRAVENGSAIKKGALMPFAATWMQLDVVTK